MGAGLAKTASDVFHKVTSEHNETSVPCDFFSKSLFFFKISCRIRISLRISCQPDESSGVIDFFSPVSVSGDYFERRPVMKTQRDLRDLLGIVLCILALGCPIWADRSFLDDFSDGDIQDASPLSWRWL